MTFDEILALLPSCPGYSALPIILPNPAFRYLSAGSEDFVGPSLQKRADASSAAAPDILVISASGAVGKTTLARELAFQKKAPLWDLAEDDAVGAHSVIGCLTKYYQQGNYAAAFGAGTMFMVIDALDEGRLKVNEAGFAAFLKDVAAQLPGKKGTCKAVLLGRTHVAEAAWLTLVDAGVNADILTIEPFSELQAAKYVDLRVARVGGPGATMAKSHTAKYREARDVIFGELRSAFTGPASGMLEDANAFLGYAPVLDAVATLLAKEANFATLIGDLQGGASGQTTSIGLLAKIVERILVREQDEKVDKNVRPAMAATAASHGWSNWAGLYAENEQCSRLLARILGTATPPAMVGLPGPLLAAYEERLSSFVPEHPFLRDGSKPANVVFESYLYAKALVNDVGGFRLQVESKMADQGHKPSRLLADFYQLLLGERSVGIQPAHICILHDALQAGEGPSNHLRLAIEGLDPEDGGNTKSVASCEFQYLDQEREIWSWSLESDLEPSGEFWFRRYLRDAAITVPCTVALGEGGKEFEVGPAVQVRCSKLRIPASNLVVGGTTRLRTAEGDPAVVLEALAVDSAVATRPRVHQITLSVAWPGAERFPWTDFQMACGVEAKNTDMHEAYRRFKRIVLTLRSHSKGSLARYRGKIEHQRVLQGPMGQALLNKLKADGILRLEGSFYHWVAEKAGELVGTSWHDLKMGIASEQLKTYLTDFLANLKTETAA